MGWVDVCMAVCSRKRSRNSPLMRLVDAIFTYFSGMFPTLVGIYLLKINSTSLTTVSVIMLIHDATLHTPEHASNT